VVRYIPRSLERRCKRISLGQSIDISNAKSI